MMDTVSRPSLAGCYWADSVRVAATVYQCLRGMAPAYLTELRQQVVVAVFGPSQPATWSYHAADCQPTAPVLSVSLVQSAGMHYLNTKKYESGFVPPKTFLFCRY